MALQTMGYFSLKEGCQTTVRPEGTGVHVVRERSVEVWIEKTPMAFRDEAVKDRWSGETFLHWSMI